MAGKARSLIALDYPFVIERRALWMPSQGRSTSRGGIDPPWSHSDLSHVCSDNVRPNVA